MATVGFLCACGNTLQFSLVIVVFSGFPSGSSPDDMSRVSKRLGHDTLLLDADATRYGAVDTPQEGPLFADFLHEHRGTYDGVILCLPNFGDETGAVAPLKDAGVPILIQVYPDSWTKCL